MTIGIRNRFQPAIVSEGPATKTAVVSKVVSKTDGLTFTPEQVGRFMGNDRAVFASAISVEEFQAKLLEVKNKIYGAADFSMAFMQEVLQDRILGKAFLDYVRAMDTVDVNNAAKRSSAKVVYSRFEIESFLEVFPKRLEELKQQRQDTPLDMMAVGGSIIARNRDIQAAHSEPLGAAQVLTRLMQWEKLPEDARTEFALELAQAAVKHQSLTPSDESQTGEALTRLTSALAVLANLKDRKGVAEYYPEAIRMAATLDGPTGLARQLQVVGALLSSSDKKTAKEAAATIQGKMQILLEARRTAELSNVPLDNAQLLAFRQVLTQAKKDPGLFEQMPDFIEALTSHPDLRVDASNATAADATAQGKTQIYKASAEESACQQAMLTDFVQNLSLVFPDLKATAVADKHKELCKTTQSLILGLLQHDQAANISCLVKELSRHTDLAAGAAGLIDATIIPDVTQRLMAAKELVLGCLENRQIDVAWNHFTGALWSDDDGQNTHRQASIFAKAAEVVVESQGNIEGSRPALRWLSESATSGIKAALDPSSQAGPNLDAARKILNLMAKDYEDFRLPPDQSVDLVNQVMTAVNDTNYPGLHEACLRVLARALTADPNHAGCLNLAKTLADQVLTAGAAFKKPYPAKFAAGTVNVDMIPVLLDAAQACSESRPLSGWVRPLVENLLENQLTPHQALANRLHAFGEFADKETLARLIPLTPSGASPQLAMALAAEPETTQQAREMVAAVWQSLAEVPVPTLTPAQRVGLLDCEAALRLAVPNLKSEESLRGLLTGFQAKLAHASREVIELVPRFMPQELIDSVLKSLGDDELKGIIANARAGETAPAAAPEGTEAPPDEPKTES
jgi:hypothetical protein